jgi:hypothetical protein
MPIELGEHMRGLILSTATLALASAAPALARHHDHDDHNGHTPAVVLFGKAGFTGHSFYTDHEVRKLSSRDMDDKVSSIRVLGGTWQVCKDDDFGGRCEIVDHSMQDMREIGMGNKISSVRPVGPGGGWHR